MGGRSLRLFRVFLGAFIAMLMIVALWVMGFVSPPEFLVRKTVAFTVLYPGNLAEADLAEIPCPPLSDLRLYVICTEDCEGIWRIVGVRGLRVSTLVNLSRLPSEPAGEIRRRINRAVAGERLVLDRNGAREMVGCYMRIDGLAPELILGPADQHRLRRARGSEEEMRELAESLDLPGAVDRIEVEEVGSDFESTVIYWDTSRADRPTVEIRYRIAGDGRLLGVTSRDQTVTDGTASGSTPGTPRI